jgi:hypothetical protein
MSLSGWGGDGVTNNKNKNKNKNIYLPLPIRKNNKCSKHFFFTYNY